MFGYIVVNQAEMKYKEFDVYHSYYCGLCRRLKEKYGIAGQLSLSYDMTFLLMVLTGVYDPETDVDSCRCIAHPFEKHITRINAFTDYMADMNVLFTYYKCQDDWEDEKKLNKYVYGQILEGKSKWARKKYQEKFRNINLLMHQMSDAEKSGHGDVDTMAGLFGQIMSQIMVRSKDEWSENLSRFAFYLGKFIYLMDAYEDVEEDIKKGTFNPLKKKFDSPSFEEDSRTILTMMMSECCKEFEQLPILENVEILRNILYSGVWCRYEAVRNKRLKKAEHDIEVKSGEETDRFLRSKKE